MGRIRELEVALNKAQQESTTHKESEIHLEREPEAARKSLTRPRDSVGEYELFIADCCNDIID